MSIHEWTKTIVDELRAAGFKVSEWEGFPLAEMPATHDERVRFLNFSPTLAADRRLYADGCLFTPAGAMRAAEAREAETRSPEPQKRDWEQRK